ncbi:MAG: ATP-dependent DNA helicase RecQ [Candidatus Kapaibacterium sp.]
MSTTDLLQPLQEFFGISSFRPMQEEAISALISGKDTFIVMPTGGGKSLCYQLPAVVMEGTALIISPLISLMKDQVDKLEARNIPVAAMNSSQSFDDSKAVFEKARSGELKLFYVSPERLESESFKALISELHISFIAVDEAHCISEWGHDFRKSYRRILQFYHLFANGRPPVIALTATATPEVRKDIKEQLELNEPLEIVTGFERPNISYAVLREYEKDVELINLAHSIDGSIIIYTSSRNRADKIALNLRHLGFAVDSYHAGMGNEARLRVQEAFHSGELQIIVATSAFGMGIDKPDVRAVIHYDLPATLEAYYQESGRAGRDGNESLAILMYNSGDERTHEFLLQRNSPSEEELLALYHSLHEMVSNPIGSHYKGSITFTRNQILALLPDFTSSISRALELLSEGGLLTIDKNASQGRTSSVKFLTSKQRREEYIYKKSSGSQLLKKLHALEEEVGLGMEFSFNADELIESLSLDKTAYNRTIRLFEANGMLSHKLSSFAKSDAKIYSITFSGPRLHEEDVTLPLERLQASFDHTLGKLREVQNYATSWKCRAAMILNYFGEKQEGGRCGKCDFCSRKLSEPASAGKP